MIKIAHCSDSHGDLPDISSLADLVAHTGDFMPDAPRKFNGMSYLEQGAIFQRQWLKLKAEDIKRWLGDRPMVLIGGNHDLINVNEVVEILYPTGINITGLEDSMATIQDITFYGFPWCNIISRAMFSHQCSEHEMKEKIRRAKVACEENDIEVFLSHNGLHGILDERCHYGSKEILHMFDQMDYSKRPNYFLFGHLHGDFGVTLHKNMLISNAATTCNLIAIK